MKIKFCTLLKNKKRVDMYLSALFNDFSRSYIQKLIDKWDVKINWKIDRIDYLENWEVKIIDYKTWKYRKEKFLSWSEDFFKKADMILGFNKNHDDYGYSVKTSSMNKKTPIFIKQFNEI